MLPGSHYLKPALLLGAIHWRDVPKGLGTRGNGHKWQFGCKEKVFPCEWGAGSSPEMAAATREHEPALVGASLSHIC